MCSKKSTQLSILTAILTFTHVQSWERDCWYHETVSYRTECFVLNLCQENISSILQSAQHHCAHYVSSNTYRKRAGKVATDNETPHWVHRKNKHWVDAWCTQWARKRRAELNRTTDATSVSCDLVFAKAFTCFFDNKNLRSKYNSASLPCAVSLVTYHAHTSLLTYTSLISFKIWLLDSLREGEWIFWGYTS